MPAVFSDNLVIDSEGKQFAEFHRDPISIKFGETWQPAALETDFLRLRMSHIGVEVLEP